jgi:tetratricopeptide (TPR) repeat protein
MVAALIAVLALQACMQKRNDQALVNNSYGMSREEALSNLTADDRTVVETYPHYADEALSCAECHWDTYADWAISHHARANRPIDRELDRDAFVPAQTIVHGSFTSRFYEANGNYVVDTVGQDGKQTAFEPTMILALEPLRQALIPYPDGRFQATEMAFDPIQGDWFNVYGEEDRQPHEWGHWSRQGMNWNTQCAYCHTTNLKKGYNPEDDTYQTTWDFHGVSCRQCHGNMDEHAAAYRKGDQPAPITLSTNQIIHQCGTCHSRREQMTEDFRPGDDFYDHFRPTLPDSLGIYYADGQVREEDYVFGVFIMSKMHHAGVSCLDCHNPHSGRLLQPIENNALCMKCHVPPGINGATPIIPTLHSFHENESTGNRCVECHMPTTHYMVRDPRRDHGFSIPDPLMTKEFGIPNACSRCHTEETVAWAIEWSDKWYGDKLNRPERERTRIIAELERGTTRPDVADILRVATRQEIPAWRSVMVALLSHYGDHPEIRPLLEASLIHEHPLVRSAAVRVLTPEPAAAPLLTPRLDDPSRMVRNDAAWALRRQLPPGSKERAALMEYLNGNTDQPGGVLRLAEMALDEDRLDEAERWVKRLLKWEPRGGMANHMMGRVLNRQGKNKEAIAAMNRAVAYEPEGPDHAYALALLYAETGNIAKTIQTLERVVKVAPAFDRAWYNLGLAYAGQEKLSEAVSALQAAERASPRNPDYPYARATVHLRLNDTDGARDAALHTLQLAPNYGPARQLLQRLGPPRSE